MKALMKLAGGEGHIEVRDAPVPELQPGEALIRVQVAGVCGSDIHIYYDRFPSSPPLILGHEFSGIVEQVGPGVAGLVEGDRVVSENNPFACLSCRLCTLGYPNLCAQKRPMGIHSDGCFAAYVKLPAHLLHTLPDGVTFEEAALTEPMAVAMHAVAHRAAVQPGESVVVFGPGTIGLLAAQIARAEGAGSVLLVGTNLDEAVRFPCARQLGIEVLNVQKEALYDTVMDRTNGVGVDVVVEASGSPKAIQDGIRILRKNGRMTIPGLTGSSDVSLDWDLMVAKAISLMFAFSSVHSDWQKCVRYLAEKQVKTAPLITHRFQLEEWKEAFMALERLEAIKPIFLIG